jgi:transposase
MARARDESRVERARLLAAGGKTVTEIAAELGVDRRTVQRWGVSAPTGRPRVSDGEASARTMRRRRLESPGPA